MEIKRYHQINEDIDPSIKEKRSYYGKIAETIRSYSLKVSNKVSSNLPKRPSIRVGISNFSVFKSYDENNWKRMSKFSRSYALDYDRDDTLSDIKDKDIHIIMYLEITNRSISKKDMDVNENIGQIKHLYNIIDEMKKEGKVEVYRTDHKSVTAVGLLIGYRPHIFKKKMIKKVNEGNGN